VDLNFPFEKDETIDSAVGAVYTSQRGESTWKSENSDAPPPSPDFRDMPLTDCPQPTVSKEKLDRLFLRYQDRRWVHPDPLEFLYAYPHKKDREIVGLIAASLAYGRVAQILKSVSAVLEKMEPSPRDFVRSSTDAGLQKDLFRI
jgi:hypothetical protein